jgi:hypothetical protein
VNVEEILFKLGIRTDGMSQGIQRAKAEVANLGEHLEKKLSAKPGEELKDIFDDLIKQSPLLENAMKIAFNPITVGFTAAVAVFSMAKDKLKEWHTVLDEQGTLAERPVGKMRDALQAARGKADESQQQFQWWESDLINGKPGEKEQERIRQRLEQARVDSGGDPIKFAQAKMAILEEEKQRAESQKSEALGRAKELQKVQEDFKGIATAENRKAKIEDRLKEEERLAEELKKSDEKLTRLKEGALTRIGTKAVEDDNLTGAAVAAISLIPGAIPGANELGRADRATDKLMVQHEQEKRDSLAATWQKTIDERKVLEAEELKGGKFIRDNLHQLQETQAEADKAKQRSLEIDKAIDAEKKAIFEAERNRRNEDLENAIKAAEKKAGANKLAAVEEKLTLQQTALARAQSLGDEEQARKLRAAIDITETERETEALNKQKAQEKFDRDLGYQQTRIEQSRLSQDQITVDQLAGMPSWQSRFGLNVGAMNQRFQHGIDRQTLAMGGGVAGRYSDMARDLQLAQEESQMALLVEGKDSARYKKAKLREESLQAGLAETGIVKIDVSMMKMAKAQEDLLEMARKEGLVVKPQMGK